MERANQTSALMDDARHRPDPSRLHWVGSHQLAGEDTARPSRTAVCEGNGELDRRQTTEPCSDSIPSANRHGIVSVEASFDWPSPRGELGSDGQKKIPGS